MERISSRFAKQRRLVAISTCLALLYSTAYGDLIGNPGLVDPVLRPLVDPLHRQGIDVLGGDINSVPLGPRPRVTLLSGVPDPQPADINAAWMNDFMKGANGFVAAYRLDVNAGGMPKTNREFIERWNAVNRSKRVFISFNARDAAIAARLRRTLEAQGFVAFTFMNASWGKPKYDTEIAGAMFSTAGRYYAVDSLNSRGKAGVAFEASMLAGIAAKQGMQPGPGTQPGGSGPSPASGGGPNSPKLSPSSGGGQAMDSWDSASFLRGVKSGWVVTRNGSGKIFVHERLNGSFLENLLYTARANGDGTWTVYDESGTRLGSIKRPNVRVGSCTCE